MREGSTGESKRIPRGVKRTWSAARPGVLPAGCRRHLRRDAHHPAPPKVCAPHLRPHREWVRRQPLPLELGAPQHAERHVGGGPLRLPLDDVPLPLEAEHVEPIGRWGTVWTPFQQPWIATLHGAIFGQLVKILEGEGCNSCGGVPLFTLLRRKTFALSKIARKSPSISQAICFLLNLPSMMAHGFSPKQIGLSR